MLAYLVFSLALVHSTAAVSSVCGGTPKERECDSDQDTFFFFFNQTSGRCDAHASMCAGGSNSFPDWTSCRHACQCQLPPEPIECPYSAIDVAPFYFDTTDNVCKAFPTENGACSANGNYFRDESACKMSCVCSLPAEAGDGSGDETSYFFNSETESCEPFSYTGNSGNANRFSSEAACKQQCQCGMPKVVGMCMALVPSYFYNNQTGQCEFFNYGGCQGNNNRFWTEENCNAACV